MTVTWTLRSGLKWSDGEPLTCDDFKYAVEWVTDPDNVGVIIDPFDISTVECTDDVTLVHHFTQVYEGYLTAFTAPLPRHFLGDIPMADQVAHEGFRADQVKDLPVSGAFKFDFGLAGRRAAPRPQRQVHRAPWQPGPPRRARLQVVRRSRRPDRRLPGR